MLRLCQPLDLCIITIPQFIRNSPSDYLLMFSSSMSSKLRPLVSGTREWMNQTPSRQMTPKMANTASCGMLAVIIGKSSPTAKEPTQLADEAAPDARPRIVSGKTSPISTQVNGAQVNEYAAT